MPSLGNRWVFVATEINFYCGLLRNSSSKFSVVVPMVHRQLFYQNWLHISLCPQLIWNFWLNPIHKNTTKRFHLSERKKYLFSWNCVSISRFNMFSLIVTHDIICSEFTWNSATVLLWYYDIHLIAVVRVHYYLTITDNLKSFVLDFPAINNDAWYEGENA